MFGTDLRSVLPDGVFVECGPTFKECEDFEASFVLPEHYEKQLEVLNKHCMDDRIQFYAESHIYVVDGCPVTTSVTPLAHMYEKEFDAYESIQMMKRSTKQSWPRKEYVHDLNPYDPSSAEDVWDCSLGCMLVSKSGKTISSLNPFSFVENTPSGNVLQTLSLLSREVDSSPDVYTFSR
jgi:hypothetical protein